MAMTHVYHQRGRDRTDDPIGEYDQRRYLQARLASHTLLEEAPGSNNTRRNPVSMVVFASYIRGSAKGYTFLG